MSLPTLIHSSSNVPKNKRKSKFFEDAITITYGTGLLIIIDSINIPFNEICMFR